MFDVETMEWGVALVWLAGIAGGAFLISWVLTDVLQVRRGPYVAALSLLTGGLTAGYVVGTGAWADFWVESWPWGILGAAAAGGFLAVMVRRIPGPHGAHRPGGTVSAWEGVVYGSAEGLLLSVLPVVVTWQMLSALGWGAGWRGALAGTAAVAASVVVIVVHHLGYREYRGRAIRSPIVGCTVLSVAYLLTASPIAAMGGHVVLHLAMLRRGMELPPHELAGPADGAVARSRSERTPAGASAGAFAHGHSEGKRKATRTGQVKAGRSQR